MPTVAVPSWMLAAAFPLALEPLAEEEPEAALLDALPPVLWLSLPVVVAPAELVATPLAVFVGATELVRKRLLMQELWHEAYLAVSSAVPLPCGHLAAHSVVALTWEALGQGTFTQAAWQQMSVAAQALRQICTGVRVADGTALVWTDEEPDED